MPISNEMTDRLYLASNDGLLICLHDRDYPTPLLLRRIDEVKLPEPKKAAPARVPARPAPAKPKDEDQPPEK